MVIENVMTRSIKLDKDAVKRINTLFEKDMLDDVEAISIYH